MIMIIQSVAVLAQAQAEQFIYIYPYQRSCSDGNVRRYAAEDPIPAMDTHNSDEEETMAGKDKEP